LVSRHKPTSIGKGNSKHLGRRLLIEAWMRGIMKVMIHNQPTTTTTTTITIITITITITIIIIIIIIIIITTTTICNRVKIYNSK